VSAPTEPSPTADASDDDATSAVIDGESIADPRPWWAPLTLAAFVALVVCSNIGTAVSTRWVNTNPEALLALSSRVRHLVAVAARIDWWAYAAIASARLALAFVVCHLIGRAYGRTVLVWFGKFLGSTPQQIQGILQMFHSAEWFVVPFFVGSNIVAAISGISKMSARRTALLVAIGLAVRLPFWWLVARLADDQVDDVLHFLARYQTPALIVSIVLTVLVLGRNLYRGRDFELDS
jgi:membrane protein DedA with SNARE-associated domain